jgi:hypothetical protein
MDNEAESDTRLHKRWSPSASDGQAISRPNLLSGSQKPRKTAHSPDIIYCHAQVYQPFKS